MLFFCCQLALADEYIISLERFHHCILTCARPEYHHTYRCIRTQKLPIRQQQPRAWLSSYRSCPARYLYRSARYGPPRTINKGASSDPPSHQHGHFRICLDNASSLWPASLTTPQHYIKGPGALAALLDSTSIVTLINTSSTLYNVHSLVRASFLLPL